MVLVLVSLGQSEELEYKKDPETFSFGILHGLKYIFIPTQWSHWVWATGHSIRGSHSLLLLEYGR